jgi:hypothetical protein
MKSFGAAVGWPGWAVLLLWAGCGWAAAAADGQGLPSADEVIRKAIDRNQRKEAGAVLPAYSYSKVTVTEEFDSTGKVRQRKERLYEVSFKGGLTSAKLIQVNGHPPAAADLKLQAEYESDTRLLAGHSKTAAGDRRENLLTPELAAHYDFTMGGLSPINGRPAYQITFEPKNPPLPVRHILDRLLNRVSGTLWIDAQEFEIARADLRLSSEVDLLGGMLGCLKKLAYTLTRTRVAEGVWFNTYSSGDFEGRKLLDSMRIKTKSQSINFHRLGLPSLQ